MDLVQGPENDWHQSAAASGWRSSDHLEKGMGGGETPQLGEASIVLGVGHRGGICVVIRPVRLLQRCKKGLEGSHFIRRDSPLAGRALIHF